MQNGRAVALCWAPKCYLSPSSHRRWTTHTSPESQAGGSRWKLRILPSVLLTPVAACHLVRTERAVPGHKGRGGISRPHPGLIGECNWHPTQNLLLLYHTKCPKQNGKQGYGEVTELHSLNSTATQGHVCSNQR